MKTILLLLALVVPLAAGQRTYRIMPVGDSITEGGSTFSNWRYPLWEKLYTAGYQVEYVGSRQSASRIGFLHHEGYGGKDSAFLAATVPANFQKFPADIVLLHAGHNHSAEEKPIPGILKDTESMITAFRAVNPHVTILLAQPITSAKLPKYSYLPELDAALPRLAARLTTPASRVVIVPQCEGFDPMADTISDHVHPNAAGAAKMADRWFQALVTVMEKPPVSYQPEILPYKKTERGDLTLHLFKPADAKPGDARPAIVFFFGGGWTHGTPLQFYPECAWFASKGLLAISADYRTAFTHGTTPFQSVADGKSAIRWVRQHAKELGVDPAKIIAAGASAGGQVAAATGTLSGFDDALEDTSVSSRPDAMALWYPVIDNGPDGYGSPELKTHYREFSPLHNVSAKTPPAIVFLGTKDQHVPVATGRDFQSRMQKAGVTCELKLFPNAGHPIYDYRTGPSPERARILLDCGTFLRTLGMFP